MNRWLFFWISALAGLLLVLFGLLVPAHLRAVDSSLLAKAGGNSSSLVDKGLVLTGDKNLGAAQLVLQASKRTSLPDWEKLDAAAGALAKEHPEFLVWGGPQEHLAILFGTSGASGKPEPLTDFVIRVANRSRVLELLGASPRPGVQELLRCRALTNTTVFPPSQSASGQAFDAAVSVAGLLVDEGQLSPGVSNMVFQSAAAANRGQAPQTLENLLLDFMSLGQRFNWGQLAAFANRIESPQSLHVLAHFVRKAGDQLPFLFSAVELSEHLGAVADYLANFEQTGLHDLALSLKFGTGGLDELLMRKQRLDERDWSHTLAAHTGLGVLYNFALDCAWRTPIGAFVLKWFLYLAGGFLIAMAFHFARPAVSPLERPLQVRGFHFAREALFALGFLLVVLLLSEPFLAQESQKAESTFRVRLSAVGSAVPSGISGVKTSIMNQVGIMTVLPILLFFVLQGLLYIACLVKLAEIRRQHVPPRIKLRLLENEDHLFDAGLYLGFVGTIISLILVSVGVIKFSLMAAYSSTSFGIIFVSIFKIFHLRPARRRLLLESETVPDRVMSGPAPALATTA